MNWHLYLDAVYYPTLMWWWFCLHRTTKQRKAILSAYLMVGKYNLIHGIVRDPFTNYERVGMLRHVWYLFTFRDPAQLYERPTTVPSGTRQIEESE